MLDTWFSSALWPFATLGWPDDTPELRAFYPTSFLTTAREILFLWVARMIMTGLEFAGDVPFSDVYVHSVIQARDGRRMSKSLGTGIDPLEEIDVHGADALRFGLLAMSSTQDVRYSDAKVQQGRDLANKLWNASRLILLNAAEVERRAARRRASRTAGSSRGSSARSPRSARSSTAYDFAHAVQERLRASSGRSSATGTWRSPSRGSTRARPEVSANAALGAGADARAAAPDHALRHRGDLVLPPRAARATSPFTRSRRPTTRSSTTRPRPRSSEAIELTRRLRAWRDLVGVPAASDAAGRVEGDPPQEFVGRLARFEFAADGGDPIASVGAGAGAGLRRDRRRGGRRALEERREELRSEVARAEGKLANERFVAKAPAEVVEEERAKLERYRAELEELGRIDLDAEAYLDSLRAGRLEARPGADAPAQHGARDAPAPLRLDPRRRHQRQVLGDADDRGAARGPRGAARAPASRRTPRAGPNGC